MLTGGSVSHVGFLLDVILVPTAGCKGGPGPGPRAWGPPPQPCGQTGLWEPLLELEEDLGLMKAISTVGSGLQHETSSWFLWTRTFLCVEGKGSDGSDLSFVRVRTLRASSYVTPIRDSLLMDTSWSPTCSRPS